ncbi:chitotriosidase-1 [Cephus cinctus]|uniref:chitinase n=1 Tax=Cephus cinctus TaxID=211228 RepID=A0AAJ7BG02_CEPCN|nr:chitotriosidase-1 [Cephus cinctus]
MNLSVIICIMTTLLGPALGKVMMCYFGSWATNRPGKGNFQVSDIEPNLCTHYIYAFVGLTANGDIRVLDERNDLPTRGGKNNIGKFVALKKTKTAPKILVSMGGWNAASTNFTRVVNHANLRTAFAKNAVAFLKKHHFDGLEMDWEYPCQRGGVKADKKGFIALLKELKAAFVKEGLLLTAAVGATKHLATPSYNIPELANIVDYINVMTYDLTTASSSKVVGHHAPMVAASYQEHNATLLQNNIEASIKFWLKSGAPASKLVLGLPLYGRTFTLAHVTLTKPGSPSAGPGHAGRYTREAGYIGYNEFCEKQFDANWTRVWDKKQKVPYAYKGNQWIGYDNERSLAVKIHYAKKLGLAGIMFWSIETDDFRGNCGCGPYPLLKASRTALHSKKTLRGGILYNVEEDEEDDREEDDIEENDREEDDREEDDIEEDDREEDDTEEDDTEEDDREEDVQED